MIKLCEYKNVVDSDFCQADKIHHSDKNNTKLNEFLKSFGFQHYFILILFLVVSSCTSDLARSINIVFRCRFGHSFVRSFVTRLWRVANSHSLPALYTVLYNLHACLYVVYVYGYVSWYGVIKWNAIL